ncbi:LacI family DNA-binding transcriptional regulator [Aureisphaera galaxeae]|uniref:LacI family DNA-binding transcriptional regulator n=1 Tax=Aureisphaera galaxeae TaxID=1538023 RepID=UPI0023509BC7|nr:LacI family DNA-binding transcriptional regulator [Aureisphaera galaxeae]MDC8003005.1 LacI family DNA-binding transcriptional regulator [Aureisphaera galaxeae]
MKQVTLKQIAENLGISITTVSKALKNYPDVSKKTKALVKEEAKKLQYKPNVFAVNLRTKQSKTVGLIIPEVVHHFFSSVINGIIEQAEKKGYLVIILQSNESYKLEKKQIDLLISKRVDGIMISLASTTVDISHLQEVQSLDIPLVMFDKISKLIPCSKIVIDDRKAAYDATKHLIDSGCKRIAHFRGALLPQNSIDRFLGYKKALEDHGLTYDPSLVYICENVNYEEGREAAEKLLKDHDDVDGIFTITDLVAVGAIAVFNERGVKVPDDISIMGFSNWFVSQAITPSLSTIDQPGYEMGKRTFKQLYKEMKAKKEGTPLPPKIKTLDTYVIKRNSTK